MSEPFKVMVVDDEDDIREIAILSLALDPTIEVRDFAAAPAAVAFLAAGGWRPDLVLMDMMMAGVDGLAAMAMIHRLPGLADLPIVIMTARARETDQSLFLQAGACAVITKPFAPLDLAARVRGLLCR